MPTMMLQPATAVGAIDQNNLLTLSWSPSASGVTGGAQVPLPDGYADYLGWYIQTAFYPSGLNQVQVFKPVALTGAETDSSRYYSQTLAAGEYQATMWAVASPTGQASGVADSSPWQTNGVDAPLAFPSQLAADPPTFSTLSLSLGQPLTVALSPTYTLSLIHI